MPSSQGRDAAGAARKNVSAVSGARTRTWHCTRSTSSQAARAAASVSDRAQRHVERTDGLVDVAEQQRARRRERAGQRVGDALPGTDPEPAEHPDARPRPRAPGRLADHASSRRSSPVPVIADPHRRVVGGEGPAAEGRMGELIGDEVGAAWGRSACLSGLYRGHGVWRT